MPGKLRDVGAGGEDERLAGDDEAAPVARARAGRAPRASERSAASPNVFGLRQSAPLSIVTRATGPTRVVEPAGDGTA